MVRGAPRYTAASDHDTLRPPSNAGWARRLGRLTITSVGVLALQGDVREHLDAFCRCGVAATPVRFAAELDDVDALALPGGESTTMSRLLRVFGLEAPLRRRLSEGMPTLSTCAGLILLSSRILDGREDQVALGVLDIEVRRNAYGSQVDSFEASIELEPPGGLPFPGVFIRAPEVVSVGPAAAVLARAGGQVVGVAQGPHVGLAFHPEMSGDDRLHKLFLDRLQQRSSVSAA